MNSQIRNPIFQTVALAVLLMGLSACSNVSFEPTSEEAQTKGLTEDPPTDSGAHETFFFNENETQAKVDVLFIVDNSRSMYEEQVKLGGRLDSFLNSLARLDWQIAVTTTDTSSGRFGVKGSLVPISGHPTTNVITKDTPDFHSAFLNTIVREELINCVNPDCPSPDERPLEAAIFAMAKANSNNAGFFREDADLAIVVLSDEDERSNGVGAVAGQTVINSFRSIFGSHKTLSVFGIVVQPGDVTCLTEARLTNLSYYGTSVSNLAALTGGVTGSICAADYSESLSNIAGRVVELVKSVTLSKKPVRDSVKIVVTPEDPKLKWTLSEGQKIVFNKPPKKGSKVDIYYTPEQ